MRENIKTQQYTFAPDEKQILEILASFEEELGEKLQESKGEIERVKYYEKFQINGIDFNNIFITTEKDVDGNISYHVYCGDSSNEILSIDSEGNIKMIPELEAFLGDIDIENLMLENEKEPDRLKGSSEKSKPKEIENKLKEKEQKEERPEEKMEKDLQEQGEDLEISYYREITDDNLDEKMKTDLSKYEEKGMAYSNKLNAFVLVGKKDGKTERVEGFEPAKPTMKTVISIDEKGEKIEKKVPHALMKTNNPEKEMSITIGQYGYIETGTIDRLPCNKRIEMQQEEAGETSKGRTEKTLTRAIQAEGREGLHKWAHEHEETLEKMENGETIENEDIEEEISQDGEHIYTEDEEKLIQDAAKNRAHMSVEGFKEILKDTKENEDIETRIDEAVEVAEEQSRGSKGY